MMKEVNTDVLKELPAPPFTREEVGDIVYNYFLSIREHLNACVRRTSQNTPIQGPGILLTPSTSGTRHELGAISGQMDCDTLTVTLTGEE